MKNYIKRNWRNILTVATFLLLGVIIYTAREQFQNAYQDLKQVNLWWIAATIPLQALNFYIYGRMYQNFFRLLGHAIQYRFMFRTVLELNFVNHVFPSGGVSGFSYFSAAMWQKRVSTAKSTLVQTMRFVFTFISFQMLLFVALLLLAIDGKANNFMLLVAAMVATGLVFATVGIIFIISSKKRIKGFFTFLTKAINKLIAVIRPHRTETINVSKARALFNEFHEDYLVLRNNISQLKQSLLHGMGVNLTEILTVYVVFLAFGEFANLGVVILAYAVANFAGLISPLPGGAGVYEALMVGVLTAGGVTVAVGLPVVIMYRVICVVLQLPVGGYWYQQTVHRIGKE